MSNVGDLSFPRSLGDSNLNRSQNGLSSSPAWTFGGGFGHGHHLSPSQTGPTTLPYSSSWPFRGGFGSSHHPSPSQTGSTTFSPYTSAPFGGGSGFGQHPSPSQIGPTTLPPYTSAPFGVGGGNNPNPSQTGPPSLPKPNNTSFSPINNNNSSLFQSPLQNEAMSSRLWSHAEDDFEDVISSMSVDKASLLKHIKRVQPSCLSSLRLRSKPHREAAYDHLARVLQDLRAAVDGNCGLDFYDKVMDSLFDLEIYGFSTSWLRHEVVQLRMSRMLIDSDKETKRRDLMRKRTAMDNLRKQVMKRMEDIDAELDKEDPPPPAPEFRF